MFRKALITAFKEFIFYPEMALDVMYWWLSVFTHLYGAVLAWLFFLNGRFWHPPMYFFEALESPYVAALGVYVILKEVRKHHGHSSGKHYGEYFVLFWLLLFIISTLTIWYSSHYYFNDVYKLIIANGLSTVIIYIGGRLSRA